MVEPAHGPEPVRPRVEPSAAAFGSQFGDPPPALAVAVAEALRYGFAGFVAATACATVTFFALNPDNAARTATLLLRGPTERMDAVGNPADLARFVASIAATTESGSPIDFSTRTERGSDLATLVVALGTGEGAADARARGERVAVAANEALSDAMERFRASIRASIEANGRSSAETAELLERISQSNPQSESIAGLMQQISTLRDEQAKLGTRWSGLQGIRVVGDVEVNTGRSASLRWLASLAAGLGALVAVPLVLRFARQVADARRALRSSEAR